MRPIKLTITGFGPYAGEQVLELDKLGTSGIVLITGPTGAGKTSIYDAMMYALYGEPTGENRSIGMLRSKYADSNTPTKVELIFEHKGNVYTITRSPEYEREKLRGEGTTKQVAEVSLLCPGKNPITKAADAEKEIRMIIGLNREQFVQVSLIAQGEFRKLLQADTQERQKIFRSIFNTGFYELFQQKLKEEFLALQKQLEDKKQAMKQDIDRIRVADASAYALEVTEAKAGKRNADAVLEVLDKVLEQDKQEQAKVSAELTQLSERTDRLKAKVVRAEMLQKARTDLEAARRQLEQQMLLQVQAKQEAEETKLSVAEEERLEKEIAALEAVMPRYQELDDKKKQREQNSKTAERLSAELQSLKQREEDGQKELSAFKEEQKTLEDVAVRKTEKANEKAASEEEVRRLAELINQVAEYETEEALLKGKQQEYLDAKEKYDELRQRYEEANTEFLDAQAGILARKLEAGKPCPVCGALEHPAPAKASESAPTQAEVKERKEASERAREHAEKASVAAKEQATKVKLTGESICGKAVALLGMEDAKPAEAARIKEAAQEKKEEADRRVQELTAELNDIGRSVMRSKALVDLIAGKEKECTSVSGETVRKKEQLAAVNATVTALEEQIKEIQNGLSHPDKAAADQVKREMQNRKEQLEQKRVSAQEKFNNCKVQIAGVKASILQLEKQLEGTVEIDTDELAAEQSSLLQETQDAEQRKQALGIGISINEEVKKAVEESAEECSKLEYRWGWMKALSDTANGTVQGKDKVMLETYIQGAYLDKILRSANLRLIKMSSGQYELVRRENAADKRGQSGLELDIIDHVNGSKRSVNTLSGGEAFLASLSLALGLSDVIQNSTGIRLDTLYVDEGFGSLDQDTLDVAYNALISLTDENRLVGIISHVEDLKRRIDKRIEVTKKKDGGSEAKIVA